MTQILDDDILINIGGKPTNNLNYVLKHFKETDIEVDLSSESPYFDIDSLGQFLYPNRNKFSVMSINIQSINAKFDKLLTFLSFLREEHKFMFSCICIQESWIKTEQDHSLFHIPNYNIINQPKTCSEHGGLIIYLKEEFTYKTRHLHKQSKLWEGLFIDISNRNCAKKITLGNIYRPPRFNNSNSTLETFMDEMRPVVSQLSKENSHVIITEGFQYKSPGN
jgi:exonuclease III